ncbi:UTP10 [Sanghuangporus sanghuang]
MPSSLATQLAKGVSLNAPLLSETARKKHFASSSYLFSPSTKGQIDDLDTIHALALNALSQLRQIHSSLSAFDEQSLVYRALFSHRAKETDRTLLAREDLAELDASIKTCLAAIGPCLLDNTAGRVLEWLIRRFRINEFNAPDILTVFLPYHESPHFAKMVSILTIDEKEPWRFLTAYKASGKAVQRSALVTEMLKGRELTRFVVSLLPETLAVSGGRNVHRTLISFNVSTILEYVTRAERRDLDAPLLAFLLPALTAPLKVFELSMAQGLRKDSILGSFVLLSALSQKCSFTSPAVKTILSGMVHCASATMVIGAHQLLTALISFLGPQQQLQDVSAGVVDGLVALPDFEDALTRCLEWKGSENLLLPTLGRLVENGEHADVVRLLITSKNTSNVVLQHLAKEILIKDNDSNVLTELYQRHPDLVRLSAEQLAAADEGKEAVIQQRLLHLAVPKGPGTDPQNIILASSSFDASVRASAVKRIADLLANGPDDVDDNEKSALKEAVLDRIYDTDVAVLDALYAESNVLVPLVADSTEVFHKLATFLSEQTVSRSVLRAHLVFFCNAFVAARPEYSIRVATTLVFPNALFTKPRNKTATAVWEAVGKSHLGEDYLFKGTKEAIDKSPDSLVDTNDALTNCLAENFRVSNDYRELLAWLLENIADERDAHTRLFCLLVLRSLLPSLSGVDRVDASFRTLNTMSMEGMNRLGDDEDVLDEQSSLKSVVAKPHSRVATQRLRFMVLMLIASTPRPQGRELEWFISENESADEAVGTSYVRLQRAAYAIMNSTVSNTNLAIQANGVLFEVLGPDALLFLSGIWTCSTAITGVDAETIRYISLRHGSAFLRARPTERPVDFQVILPSLLSCLQESDKRIRAAAIECIAILLASSSGSKPTTIYAYDQVYGSASSHLQYIDWSDETKYLNLLVDYRDHLVNDPDCLVLFHHEHISRTKAENKKDAKQRRRILCFLLSHVLCCPSLPIRLSILKSLSRVSDQTKLEMLLPIIERALDSPSTIGASGDLETYALQSFDSSVAKLLNSESSSVWPILIRAIDYYLARGEPVEQWTRLRTTLQDSLFAVLSTKRQLEVSHKLIERGCRISDEHGIKRLLSQSVKKPALVIGLLQSLQPDIKDASERTPKKPRKEAPSEAENDSLSRLSFLAEVLSAQKLPASIDLVSALLDTLNRIMTSCNPAQPDVIYVVQLTLACLESSISHIEKLPNVTSNAIRTDVLVELMRTSENPQTFNQALLLLASLAKLSSSSVLHNVMPIFTFMGSNVFHRDDSYSFKVIQKTIESIVPVAASSMREKYENRLDLYIGSRQLLRTFTDASTHIPRHRRTSFFTHLIDVLGPETYLAPVLMLLTDKFANRVSRQTKQEAQATLALPLSVMQHYVPKTQLAAMTEIINEAQRLLKKVEDHASEEKVFLELAMLDEHAVSPSTIRKRQCQALLILTGFGMKQIPASKLAKSPASDLEFVISSLMELATLDRNGQALSDLREIGSSAQWALLQSMTVISAQFFASTILSMLSSDNRKIYQAAFDLLASRVREMKAEAREEISPVIGQIITRMTELMPALQDGETISEGMKALMSIGESASSKEEPALTSVVPIIIDIIKKYPGVSQAIGVVPVLTAKLGPRIIPYLRSLVGTCVSLVRSSDATLSRGSLVGGIDVLSSLLKAIPTFWGVQEIILLIELYLDEGLAVVKGLSSHLEKLTKLLFKQIPGKTVLSSLLQCRPSLDDLKRDDGLPRFNRFFELLKRCLHFASRPDVLENLRGLFSLFLEAFDARSILPSHEASETEDKIIAAYLELVVKLNETAFQPLFRRMVDWAFGDNSSPDKQITFCRHYSGLLDLFKELMTPYMSLLVNHFAELLTSFTKEENTNKELWLAAIETLSKSFVVDDGVYWRDDRLRLISEPLTQQIPVCINLSISEGRTLLSKALSALVDCLEDDTLAKAMNHAVLMHTRSEDARIRIFALQCSVAIWQAHGSKLRAFGPETATFIIECAEDGNDEVVRICRQLRDAVQSEVGTIEGL